MKKKAKRKIKKVCLALIGNCVEDGNCHNCTIGKYLKHTWEAK